MRLIVQNQENTQTHTHSQKKKKVGPKETFYWKI